jgi:hypothetical protein
MKTEWKGQLFVGILGQAPSCLISECEYVVFKPCGVEGRRLVAKLGSDSNYEAIRVLLIKSAPNE